MVNTVEHKVEYKDYKVTIEFAKIQNMKPFQVIVSARSEKEADKLARLEAPKYGFKGRVIKVTVELA